MHCLCLLSPQARAFQQGLELNPTDKIMRQGFWDAVNLLSQDRPVGALIQQPVGAAAAAAAANAGRLSLLQRLQQS